MIKPIIDVSRVIARPLTSRLNIPKLSVNPRTGRMKRASARAASAPPTPTPAALIEPTSSVGIAGIVRGDNNRPLGQVSIAAYLTNDDGSVDRLHTTTTSADDGSFSITVPPNTEKIILICSLPGMTSKEQEVKIKDDQNEVKVKMTKANA